MNDKPDRFDETEGNKLTMDWRNSCLWAVTCCVVTILLVPLVAFVLNERISRDILFLTGFMVALYSSGFGPTVSTWPSGAHGWACVIALSAGCSWVLSFIDPGITPKSVNLVAGFMVSLPFCLAAVAEYQQRHLPSSPVPDWHPDNI